MTYTRGNFGASFDLNHTGKYADAIIATVGLDTPQFAQFIAYRTNLTTLNLGFTYRVRPNATMYLNVNNLTAQGTDRYVFSPDRPRAHVISPRIFTFGVTGRF